MRDAHAPAGMFHGQQQLFVSFTQSDVDGRVLASEDTNDVVEVGVYARLIQTKILVARGNQCECQLSKRDPHLSIQRA